jgi:iron-sulfur cluster repair protein YtfE (RIC family)
MKSFDKLFRFADSEKEDIASMNAIELLKSDHARVKNLFKKFEDADSREKQQILEVLTKELEIHAAVEQEIIYPVLEEMMSDKTDEAYIEHELVVYMLEEISQTSDKLEARVSVLRELVEKHVEEEENELLPALQSSDKDLDELADEIRERKMELEQEDEVSLRREARKSNVATHKGASTRSRAAKGKRTTRSSRSAKSSTSARSKSRSHAGSKTKTTSASKRAGSAGGRSTQAKKSASRTSGTRARATSRSTRAKKSTAS